MEVAGRQPCLQASKQSLPSLLRAAVRLEAVGQAEQRCREEAAARPAEARFQPGEGVLEGGRYQTVRAARPAEARFQTGEGVRRGAIPDGGGPPGGGAIPDGEGVLRGATQTVEAARPAEARFQTGRGSWGGRYQTVEAACPAEARFQTGRGSRGGRYQTVERPAGGGAIPDGEGVLEGGDPDVEARAAVG